MEEIRLVINGRDISCLPGTSILDAAIQNGIKIPTLCHHPNLKPFGACRLCIVEDEKSGRIMASCVTPVSPGMSIQTDSPEIIRHRRNIVRLMMANHPESCIVCSQGNRCELRQIAAELGVGQTNLYPMPHYTGLEEANPFIIRDLSKCILCGRCIRADHELVMVGAIDYNLRGFKSLPATLYQMPLEKSNCTFCGTCVSLCPTGALSVKNTRYVGTPKKESLTVCGFCGVGCSIVMGSEDNQIVEVNPSHQEDTVNRSTLCVRGHFGHDFLNSPHRLISPLTRRDGEFLPVDWDEALEIVAKGLISVKKKHGPQSVAFLGSSKCTIEENYLFQKMARAVLGTNNVDNGGYTSGQALIKRINEKLDGGCRVTPLACLDKAEVIFVIGANPIDSLPVASYYLKRASRIKGIPLIVVDPRKTDLVPFSSLWLPVAPQSDYELLNALAAILYKRKSYDEDFINLFTEGFELYSSELSSLNLKRISETTGLDIGLMEKAADLMEGKKIAFVIGQGVLQQRFGRLSMDALLNLALITGSLDGEGKGFYFLSKENNQVGALDMGAVPDLLPGRKPLEDGDVRKNWEQLWEVELPSDPGFNMIRMIKEAEKGNLKALYIMGENPIRSLPGPERIKSALGKLEFIVVQDILENETTDLADVVLPGAAFSEKAGAFTNLEGRVQLFEPAVLPPGEAKPDWEILDLLLARMGHNKRYSHLKNIRGEISHMVPMYSGFNGNEGKFWIKESSGLRLFRSDGEGGLISFSPIITKNEEKLDKGYPFKAIISSQRYHLGSGTRTGHSDRITDFGLKGAVEISVEDGTRLHLKEGDQVKISSLWGSINREIILNRDLKPGLIFIPTGFHGNDAMGLIELRQLGEDDSPGWKECLVKLEKIGD